MTADLLIRGARISDGTGLPAFTGDVEVRDGRITRVGRLTGTAAADGHRRRRARPRARIRRRAHPLRRAALLRAVGIAVVVARRDDRPHRQLRVHHRARRSPTTSTGSCSCWPRSKACPPTRCAQASTSPAAASATSSRGLDGRIGVNTAMYVGHAAVRRWVMGAGGERARRDRRRDPRDAGAGRRRDARRRARAVDLAARRARRSRGQPGAAQPRVARGDRRAGVGDGAVRGGRAGAPVPQLRVGLRRRRSPPARATWRSRRAASRCTSTCCCASPTTPTRGAPASTCSRATRATVCASTRWRRPTRRVSTSPSTTPSCSTRCRSSGRRCRSRSPSACARLADPAGARRVAPRPRRARRPFDPVGLDRRCSSRACATTSTRAMVGHSIAELARPRGVDELDTLLDLALAEDLETLFVINREVSKEDRDVIGFLLRHPLTMPGSSDGGAHVNTFCGADYTTRVLTEYVDDEFTFEDAVRRLSAVPAATVGLWDRGEIRPGRGRRPRAPRTRPARRRCGADGAGLPCRRRPHDLGAAGLPEDHRERRGRHRRRRAHRRRPGSRPALQPGVAGSSTRSSGGGTTGAALPATSPGRGAVRRLDHMGAVRFCTANLLRRRLGGMLAIAALIGLAGAVTLAAFAGARRTETAYPRLLDRRARARRAGLARLRRDGVGPRPEEDPEREARRQCLRVRPRGLLRARCASCPTPSSG